jgi:hypothetical protein
LNIVPPSHVANGLAYLYPQRPEQPFIPPTPEQVIEVIRLST